MKLRDWAMIGVGMTATILYNKYASCYVENAIDMVAEEVEMIKDEINQMMK